LKNKGSPLWGIQLGGPQGMRHLATLVFLLPDMDTFGLTLAMIHLLTEKDPSAPDLVKPARLYLGQVELALRRGLYAVKPLIRPGADIKGQEGDQRKGARKAG